MPDVNRGDTYLYVSQHGAQRISVLRLNPDNGDLARVQDMDVGGKVMPLAVSPDRRFLYAALRDEPEGTIASFAIDGRNGMLTPLGSVPAADSSTYISTDRTGRFLFASTNPHVRGRPALLSMNRISDHGLVQAPFQRWITPPKLHAVLPDPGNRFILAPSCDGETIERYPFDAATGILGPEPLAPVSVKTAERRGPRHFRFHPNCAFLYLLNEYDATISVFGYDSRDGALTDIETIDAKPADYIAGDRRGRGISAGAADIHLTPDGRWLYASIRGALAMAIFSVDAENGRLSLKGHFPVSPEPRGFAIDPFGRYLFVAGDASANLIVHRIDPANGQCTQLAEYAMGDGPNWIEAIRLG